MIVSRMVAALALALALAPAMAPGVAAAQDETCDRARSIFAERDRNGDVAATRPTRPCATVTRRAPIEADSRPTRREPDIHRGSPFRFSHSPRDFSSGFNPPPR